MGMATSPSYDTPSAIAKLDPQNRVALPRRIREEANIEPGTEFVLFVEGDGRVVLMTRRAITERIHAMFADSGISSDDIRGLRDEDAQAEEEKWQRMQQSA